jgi:hypothetical protein
VEHDRLLDRNLFDNPIEPATATGDGISKLIVQEVSYRTRRNAMFLSILIILLVVASCLRDADSQSPGIGLPKDFRNQFIYLSVALHPKLSELR